MANAEAEEYKKKGNEAFAAKSWDEAIKHYNKAVTLDPSNATYYSNRSGAWSSKGNHESALSDANKCISHDPSFMKGYTRKGKALFDMNKWDEAEAAYKQGLEVDSSNEACLRGVADVETARKHRRRSTSASSGARGTGMMEQVLSKFKKGGRMQTYFLMFGAYYLFTNIWGRSSKGQTSSTIHETAPDDEDAEPAASPGQPSRSFAEVDGTWLSFMQTSGKSDTTLLLLHRTSLSAESEYGTVFASLANLSPTGGLRLLAPDRPCHGFSPCPPSSESSGSPDWLHAFLNSQSTSKHLGIIAAGHEAAGHALALARRRPEVAHLWFLSPAEVAPAVQNLAFSADVSSWIQKQDPQGAATAQCTADAVRWAVLGTPNIKDTSKRKPLSVPKLPDSCKVTILYTDNDEEETKLSSALEPQGIKPKSRTVGKANLPDILFEEVQRMTGAVDSSVAEEDS